MIFILKKHSFQAVMFVVPYKDIKDVEMIVYVLTVTTYTAPAVDCAIQGGSCQYRCVENGNNDFCECERTGLRLSNSQRLCFGKSQHTIKRTHF